LRLSRAIIGGVVALALGCATGGGTDDSSGDSSVTDATTDVGSGGDAGCPTGRAGANCQSCAGGFHMCSSSCVQDHPNSPDAGCTQGCSGACPTPQNGTATCTSNGACDFACQTSFNKTDAGCECPSGEIVCTNVCQQCCSDSDCPNHVTCTSNGTCSGCQANWGDCNNNPTDGCETELNSTSNCGSCGHSCCSGLCCGFLGLGGSESCNVSGNTYACGC